MKRCSQCNRTYSDESLTFCLADGSLLSAPYDPNDPNATLRMSAPTNPTATSVLPSTASAAPVQRSGHSAVLYLSIALAVALVLAGGFLLFWMKGSASGPAANSRQEPAATQTNASITPQPQATVAVIDISGDWVDQFGFASHITQQGDAFQMTAVGRGCRGRFVTTGRGVIRGNAVESDYTSTYSSGHCSGAISPDGMRMTSDCTDTACGRFLTSARRQ